MTTTNLTPIKVCSCGIKFFTVPESALFMIDRALGGWYWDCQACKTTLFIPTAQALEIAAA